MPQHSHTAEDSSSRTDAVIIPFESRAGAPAPNPDTLPFTASERAALRRLLALGPDRIIAMVRAMETLKTACPTARRELSGD